MTELTPHFEDVQSHYDLSDDFYRLFPDPTQTYQRYMKYPTGSADMFRKGYRRQPVHAGEVAP